MRMHAPFQPNEYAIARVSFAVSYFSFLFLFSNGWIGDFRVFFSSLILSFRIRISSPRAAFAHMIWCDRRCSVRSVCCTGKMHSIDQPMIWFPFNWDAISMGFQYPFMSHFTRFTWKSFYVNRLNNEAAAVARTRTGEKKEHGWKWLSTENVFLRWTHQFSDNISTLSKSNFVSDTWHFVWHLFFDFIYDRLLCRQNLLIPTGNQRVCAVHV